MFSPLGPRNLFQTLLKDSGNIIRRIEEAEKYLKFIEQLQQKIQVTKDDSFLFTENGKHLSILNAIFIAMFPTDKSL